MKDNTLLLTSISTESLRAMITDVIKENLAGLTVNSSPEANDSDRVLESAEVIKLLKISPATLQNWKLQGKLPFYRIGRRVYFKESEVLTSLNRAHIAL